MAHLPIKQRIQLVHNPYSVAAADLNGDKMPDLITANSGTNTISVLMNKRNGTYANQTTYTVNSKSQFCIS